MKKNNIIYLNGLIDLAQSRLGSKIVYKTDEFFASAKRIINPWPPVFKEGVFDKHGKWMDGWETRRKRTKGYDYLILKFGKPGVIKKVDVDTSYFSGNHPDQISLQACISKKKIPDKKTKWITIIKKSKTKIKDKVFVGSNSSLVAPLTIEQESIIGAGSVITKKVKKKSLALTRSLQTEIKNYKRK